MTLRFDDRWIWDFWLVSDQSGLHHVFYLQAPKSLGDPDLRHANATIGHAVSQDLIAWTPVADALSAGARGAFDDGATWTGSIVNHDGVWVMFYTGTSDADDRLVQRIGLATSDDLNSWSRRHDIVLSADPAFYERLDLELWGDEAWRDPYAFLDPDDGRVHLFVTARTNHGETFERGCIAHLSSADLRSWEVLEPLSTPPGFGQLEVPQLIELEGRWYLLFASDIPTQSEQRRRTGPGTGTYHLVGDSRYGPFEMIGDGALVADPSGTSYAGRIHQTADGTPWFLDWDRCTPGGSFIGGLADPRRVRVRPDGSLSVDDQLPTGIP